MRRQRQGIPKNLNFERYITDFNNQTRIANMKSYRRWHNRVKSTFHRVHVPNEISIHGHTCTRAHSAVTYPAVLKIERKQRKGFLLDTTSQISERSFPLESLYRNQQRCPARILPSCTRVFSEIASSCSSCYATWVSTGGGRGESALKISVKPEPSFTIRHSYDTLSDPKIFRHREPRQDWSPPMGSVTSLATPRQPSQGLGL